MSYERITDDPFFDGHVRETHELRYKLAGLYTDDSDTVLDAACGTGYGKKFLKGKYVGVDREDLCGNLVADLNVWQPDFEFDVFVSFEILEHLENYQNLLDVGRKAKRLMILSTPIIPTVGKNPFHKQDFDETLSMELSNFGWKIKSFLIQDKIYGIWILKR